MSKFSLLQKYIFSVLFALAVFFAFPVVVNAATFTVDSTGDGADAAVDGLCATSGGVCTLRAAITEASATGGPHTINFNIPTSDTGCRDFDTESTLSSCDGVGGDDFWTINPASVLPTITSSGITIDGATQTTNQGNTNISGPEIQIDGTTVGENRGLYFTGTNGTVNSLIINRFGSAAAAIEITGDGFSITNSYVGPFAKGLTGATTTNRSGFGLFFNVASGTVGTSSSDGNVISGNNTYGINMSCGTGLSGERVNIAGNKFGLGTDGTTSLVNGTANIFMLNDCQSIVGGDGAANRNYFAGGSHGILHQLSASDVVLLEVYNNFFGTDISGTLSRPHTVAGMFNNAGSGVNNNLITYIVGAEGKGNLFRYSVRGIQFTTGGRRDLEIAYNAFSDHTNYGMYFENNTRAIPLSKIHHNYFGAFSPDPYFGLTTGINTLGGHFLRHIQGLEIYNNVTVGGSSGNHLRSASGSNFHNNEISGNTGNGLNLATSTSTVANNKIHDNAGNGIDMINEFSLVPMTIINNEIYNNGRNIRLSQNSSNFNVEIRENEIYGATFFNYVMQQREDGVGTGPTVLDDAGDEDLGNNFLQNRPEIREIIYLGAGQYRINGIVDGKTLEAPFEVEICESENHVSGFGGCIDPLGVVTTASSPDSVSGSSNYYNWSIDVQTAYATENENILFTGLVTGLGTWTGGGWTNNGYNTSDFSQIVGTDGTRSNNGFTPTYSILEYDVPLTDPTAGETITDTTPLLNWEASEFEGFVNPEVDHYDVIVDNAVVASVDDSVTQYQLTTALSGGIHTWKVIAYRIGNVVTGQSSEETFTVNVPRAAVPTEEEAVTYTFKLVSPIDEKVVEDTTPLFDWQDISSESEYDIYELYINNKFVASGITKSELELPESKALTNGSYVWQVIAYKKVGAEYEEVGRSNIEVFKVNIPEPEVTVIPTEVVVPTTIKPTEEIKELPWTGSIQGKETLLAIVITTAVAGISCLWIAGSLGWIPFLAFLKKKKKIRN